MKSIRFRFPLSRFPLFPGPRPVLIATFGTARLVKWPSARSVRHELLGGTAADLTAAREWCSLYAHDLVFSVAPSPTASRAFAA